MAPEVTGRGSSEVQHVWIYCRRSEEAQNIANFCRETRQLQRLPQVLGYGSAPSKPPWHDTVKLLVHQLPFPYTANEQNDFWNDVDALLSASVESLSITKAQQQDALRASTACAAGHLDALRWPSVFVTDRHKLFHASSDTMFRSLAEAAGLRDINLLPVMLASDFKKMCGNLIELPNISIGGSLALDSKLGADDLARLTDSPVQSNSRLQSPVQSPRNRPRTFTAGVDDESASASGSATTSATVQLGVGSLIPVSPGIYFQYCATDLDFDGQFMNSGRHSSFGSRALGVFSDGQCAYAAVSSDGTRCVQAIGSWEVINGQFVIGGSNGNADVGHLRLISVGHEEVVGGVEYAEPVHISLEDLTGFEFPTTLSECVTSVGESLREELLKIRAKRGKHCQVSSCLPRSRPTRNTKRSLAAELQSGTTESSNSKGALPQGAQLSDFSDSRGGNIAQSNARLSDSTNLKGFLQGDAPTVTPAASSTDQCQFFRTCPLRPGTYHFQRSSPQADDYRCLDMTLHVDGSYAFTEKRFTTVVCRANGSPLWTVEGKMLILGSRDALAHSFLLKEPRGTKNVEQRITKIVIPVDTVINMCSFSEFPQQLNPFPNHRPLEASKCICGILDPASPALQDPPAELDAIPLRAVEADLHDRGLHSDELLSDLQHIGKNSDGTIGPNDLEELQSYGKAMASPEQLSGLREALERRFGSLNVAFDACCNVAKDIEVTAEDAVEEDEDEALASHRRKRQIDSGIDIVVFERFLQQAVQNIPKKDKAKSAVLEVWLQKHTTEEIQEVFTSLNASQRETVDFTDFLTLSLHTAMASMQRLAHFQSWITQKFGPSQESFQRAFDTLDHHHKKKLPLKQFIQAVESFGYPCSATVLHCIFGLMDRKFKGNITVADFENLRNFNSSKLLNNLQDLKKFADEKFGGIDECFDQLVKLEKKLGGKTGKAKSISFRTFEKALTQGGFTQAHAGADLEMLFLFLDEASDQSTSGCLTYMEWQLLRGFEARAITGSPARLRRFLESQFGTMQEAYKQLQASWQARVIRERLTQAALSALVRSLRSCAHDGKSANFRSKGGWGAARCMKAFRAAKAICTASIADLAAPAAPNAHSTGTDATRRTAAAKSGLPAIDHGTHIVKRVSLNTEVEAQRPHTHEGTRNRSTKRPLLNVKGLGATGVIPSSARRPANRGTTYSLPYETPLSPTPLRTEQWQPEVSPFAQTQAAPAAPQSARCHSAPAADQKGRSMTLTPRPVSRPRFPDFNSTAERRCKFQLMETQPGFTALQLACSGRASSQGSSRNGWTASSACGAISAINWSMM